MNFDEVHSLPKASLGRLWPYFYLEPPVFTSKHFSKARNLPLSYHWDQSLPPICVPRSECETVAGRWIEPSSLSRVSKHLSQRMEVNHVMSLPPVIPCRICTTLPLPDFKSMRLASRLLERCAENSLFEVVYVDIFKGSFEKVLGISAIPKFALGVCSGFFHHFLSHHRARLLDSRLRTGNASQLIVIITTLNICC